MEVALNKCIFNLSILTGDRTWIHSTRIEGAVGTWVTFKSVPPEIPDSVIKYYALLFGKTCTQGDLHP